MVRIASVFSFIKDFSSVPIKGAQQSVQPSSLYLGSATEPAYDVVFTPNEFLAAHLLLENRPWPHSNL